MATRRSNPPGRTAESVPAESGGTGAGTSSASTETPAPRRRATVKKVQPPPVAQPVAVAAETRREMIARAAYFRAERRGFAPGSDQEDWLAAEKEVDALLSAGQGIPQ